MLFLGVAACTASRSEAPPPIPDALQLDASPETRSALGVVRWGLETTAPGASVLRGYDENHHAVVEIARRMDVVDATHRSLETALDGQRGRALLRTVVEVRPGRDEYETITTIEANTFEGNPEASRTIDRAERDLLAGDPRPNDASGSGGLLVRQSLRPLEKGEREGVKLLEEQCRQLLAKCDVELVKAEKEASEQSSACRQKSTSWTTRQMCNAGISWWSESGCKAVEQDRSRCEAATKRAIQDAESSKACAEKAFWAEACANPEGFQDRLDASERDRKERDRLAQEKQETYQYCTTSCDESALCDHRYAPQCTECHKSCADDLYEN